MQWSQLPVQLPHFQDYDVLALAGLRGLADPDELDTCIGLEARLLLSKATGLGDVHTLPILAEWLAFTAQDLTWRMYRQQQRLYRRKRQ